MRSNIKEGTALGIEAKEYINKGRLVPDNLTIALIEDRLKKEDCSKGFPILERLQVEDFILNVGQVIMSNLIHRKLVINVTIADAI